MTPMVAAVMEKFLAVEVGRLGSLVADVRSEERNMWKENWRGVVVYMLREKVQ